mmetsp:Transcript_10268/g.32486  ORF Transcript_10268/g.32486 Transcript_10268/m.32486 type:complete len:109 (+) Transcript_10268:357-683(+)
MAALPRCLIVAVCEHKTSCTCRICHYHVYLSEDRKAICGQCKASGVEWRVELSEIDRDIGAGISIMILGLREIAARVVNPREKRNLRPNRLRHFKDQIHGDQGGSHGQ